MKLNKRVLASAALSTSLVASVVTPVAWATDGHVNCAQDSGDGSDPHSGFNVNDADYLQPNCELSQGEASQPGVEEELKQLLPSDVVGGAEGSDVSFGDNGENLADGEQQSGQPLSVNEVKEGDEVITGFVYLLPGEQKIIQAHYPNRTVATKVLKSDEKSGEEGKPSGGKVVTFTFDIPEDLQLKAGDEITVSRLVANSEEAANKDKPVKIIVKAADKGNGQAPGGGAGNNPSKPPVPGDNENPRKPPAPGGGENLPKPPTPGGGAGEDSSNFGNIFGVVAGLAGLAAVVAGIAKIFHPNSGLVRFLQPLRDILAQFNIKF
ncbi:intracellular motility protein A [Corynebacterium accolens]|uniref:hypothetical protein n=1 Tax=Corynebacterium accolens TaxID=38284 RepID=UPI0001E169B2|nr:hypothetical protein [Corynebacterium accolens]EFM43228.1 hypothetical protein HMPREF0277_1703 [Corynebacterium accolens ATCC 49726]MDK4233308.1 intracellular motility protein A [Corynebacterium accolens]